MSRFKKARNKALLTTLYWRFAAAFLLLGVVILTISTLRSNFTYKNYAQKEQQALAERSQQRLDALVQSWAIEARRTVSELEFMRIDQLSTEARQLKLTAFFTAQGENRAFDSIVITDYAHTRLFSEGCRDINHFMTQSQETLILATCDHKAPALYHVIEQHIWLGEQGNGYAHFAKEITPSILQTITPSNGFTLLSLSEDAITSTERSLPLPIAAQRIKEMKINDAPAIFVKLSWPEHSRAELNILKRQPPAEPWWVIVMPPVMVVTFSLVIIWLILGRWMQYQSTRINLLWSGTQIYAQTQTKQKALPYLQSFQSEEETDDVARLGRAILYMMEQVDAAREQEHLFSETLTLLEEAVITLDTDGNLVETSSGWHRLTRLSTPTGERFLGYIHPDEREGWIQKFNQLLTGEKETIHVRFRLNTNLPAHPWLEGRFLAHHSDINTVSIRGALRDVTQSYLQEQQITYMALHDALTGLANRILLEDRLKQALLRCERNEERLAILFFDLDHFKQINDSLGHKIGDKLLIALSERIASCLRPSDTLARWGGDEFVILLSNITDDKEVHQITEQLLTAMQPPFMLDENELPASFSIGVSIYPDDASDIQALFSNADRAMFYAKSQGRNQACFFSDMTYKESGKQELYIQNRLANAIKNQLLCVHYQPIIECATGRVYGVEALARWYDERYGWVSPATFVPMAENLGLIFQLGQYVLSQAFRALSTWQKNGLHLYLAVNVSSRQLFAPGFIPSILTELAANQLSKNHIILEVTESLALRDVDHAMERLQELQQQGFRIAIDDFGTGHSSLAQLQEISADKLKIDRQFIARLDSNKGHNMVKAVTNMAQALNLTTVAEGVETFAQSQLLCEMGVNYLQGFYFAKPMPVAELEIWVRQHHGT